MMPLRILIADDHAAMRRSVRALVESHAQWSVCAEAADGEEAVERAEQLQPDVALLDYEMPKLNGIEAAQQIRARAPTVQILVLTMHDSREMHEEARRSGAREVVMKSGEESSLLDAIESLVAPDKAIPLAGSVVREQRHIAAFFRSEWELYHVLGPFVADGIARGDKAVHIIGPPDPAGHMKHLEEVGIDARAAEARHQLDLRFWSDTYLRDGHFDESAMIALVQQVLRDGKTDGYPMTRAIANMAWALGDQPGVRDLAEYEARLNDALADYADVVICAYDLTKFPGEIIVDVLRGHPMVIIAGVLQENPFYTTPAALIDELRNRYS